MINTAPSIFSESLIDKKVSRIKDELLKLEEEIAAAEEKGTAQAKHSNLNLFQKNNMNYQFTLANTASWLFTAFMLIGFALISNITSAQCGDLYISAIIDGGLTGGQPKAVRLTASAPISDLSIYGLGSANNGGGSDGEEFSGMSGSLGINDDVWIAENSIDFIAYFGFSQDYTTSAVNVNGDDAIELFCSGSVVDVFGEIDNDGTGECWEYMDGFAYRNNPGQNGGVFDPTCSDNDWMYSGKNALDNISFYSDIPNDPFGFSCAIGTITISNIRCEDNGFIGVDTPFDPSDDVTVFDLTVSGTGSNGFTLSSFDPAIGGGPLSYNSLHNSFAGSLGSAGGGDITIVVTDNDSGCFLLAQVSDPGSCALCPENLSNTGSTANSTFCADTEIDLCLNGDNFPPSGEICWYQVPNAGDIPDPATDELLACVSIPSGVTTGGPVINEVLFNTSEVDGNGLDTVDDTVDSMCEAIEIAGTPGLDLSCYVLTDGETVIVFPPGTMIPADGFLVIAEDASATCDDFDPSDVDIELSSCGCCASCQLILTNPATGDFLNLLDPSGAYVDGILWGDPSPTAEPGSNETIPASISCSGNIETITTNVATPEFNFPVGDGQSIARDPDVIGGWVVSEEEFGTENTIGMANNMPASFCTSVTLDESYCGEIYINSLITTLPSGCDPSSGVGVESQFTMACPNPTIADPGSFCPELLQIMLTVTEPSATSYSWSTDGSGTLVASNTATLTVTGDVMDGDVFTVEVMDANGCAGEAEFTIDILEAPVVEVAVSSGSCAGDEVVLSSTAGMTSYSWQSNGNATFDNNNFQNPTVSNAADGEVFTLVATGPNGCSNSDNVTLSLDPLPSASLTSISACANANGTTTYNLNNAALGVTGGATGVTLTWFTDAALNNEISTPASHATSASQVYAKVTNNNTGCFDSSVVTLISHPLPTPSISGDTEFCEGTGGVSLDAGSGFTSYLWSPDGETTQTISGAMAGSYTVTVTDGNGCMGTSSAHMVTENALPTPSINGDTEYCEGTGGVTLDAGAGFSAYSWSPGGATTQILSGAMAGSYTVTVTDGNGCMGTSSAHVVTENVLPTPSISGNTEYCAGTGGVTLDAGTGYASYSWSPGGETTQTLSGVMAGTYTVTVTDGNGCMGTSSAFMLTENALPTPSISGDIEYCEGTGGVTLDAGAGYASYSWSPGGATTQMLSGAMASTYTVTVTDGNGCMGTSSTHMVTENALPTPSISGDTEYCEGTGGVTLDAGAGYASYSWSPGGATTQMLSGVMAGTYSVTVTDGNGCMGTSSDFMVSENALPMVSIQDQEVCVGTTSFDLTSIEPMGQTGGDWTSASAPLLSFDAVDPDDGPFTYTYTDANSCVGTDMVSFTFTNPPTINIANQEYCEGTSSVDLTDLEPTGQTGGTWSNSSGNVSDPENADPTAGPYTYTFSNGCPGSTSVTFTEIVCCAPPTLSASTSPACQGVAEGSIDLSLSGGNSGDTYTYEWSPGGATSEDLMNVMAGTYTVVVTVNGDATCTATGMFTVAENALPSPSISGDTEYCAGTGGVTLDAGAGFSAYSWSTGESTQIKTGTMAGSFTVTVTDVNGCMGTSASHVVTENALPTPSISGDTEYCAGTGGVTLDAGSGYASYSWSPGGAMTQTLSGAMAGTYTVTVTDGNGCIGTSSAHVVVENTLPMASPMPAQLCIGNMIDVNGMPSGGSGTYTSHIWTDDASGTATGYSISNTTVQTASIDASGATAGTVNLTYTVTDDNGCMASSTVTITILPLATADVNDGGSLDEDNDQFAHTEGFCSGGSGEATFDLLSGTAGIVTEVTATPNIVGLNISVGDIIMDGDVIHPDPLSVNDTGLGEVYIVICPYTNGPNGIDNMGSGDDCVSSTLNNEPDATTSENCVFHYIAVQFLATADVNDGGVMNEDGDNDPHTESICNGETPQALLDVLSGNNAVVTSIVGDDDITGLALAEGDILESDDQIIATALTNNTSVSQTVTVIICPYSFGPDEIDDDGAGNDCLATTVNNNPNGSTVENCVTYSVTVLASATADVNDGGVIDEDGDGDPHTESFSSGESGEATFMMLTGTAGIVTDVVVSSSNLTGVNLAINDIVSDGAIIEPSVLMNTGTNPETVTFTICPYSNGPDVMDNMGVGDDCLAMTVNNMPVVSTLENCITHTIQVNPIPTLDPIANPDELCNETDIYLFDNGTDANVDTWNWTGPNGFSSSMQNPVILWEIVDPVLGQMTNPEYPGVGTHTYTLTVTNIWGSTATATTEVTVHPLPELVSCTAVDPLCHGDENGSIDITITSGTQPFTFLWTRLANGTTYTTEDLSNVGAGMYTLTVTDSEGCELYLEKELEDPNQLEISLDMLKIPSCPNTCDGMISFLLTGGTAPYSYAWSDLTGPNQPASRNNLCAGSYTFTLTDANGCSEMYPFVMIDPLPLTTNAGPDSMVCGITPYTHTADPAPPGSTGTWTHDGTGSLTDINDPNAVYTPGAGDLGNNVTFTWSYPSPFGNCPAMDNMVLEVKDSGCGGFPWDGSIINNN